MEALLANELTWPEYRCFREAAVRPELKEEHCGLLGTLQARGLLSFEESGPVFALELLEYYSGIFGTDRELRLRQQQLLNSALNYCVLVYGVFTYRQFVAVARRRNGDQLSEQGYQSFWKELFKGIDEPGNRLHALNDELVYSAEAFTRKDAEALWLKLQKLPLRYVPTPEEMDGTDLHGLTLPVAAQLKLQTLIDERSYMFDRSPEEVCSLIVGLYHHGVPADSVLKKLPRHTMSYFYSRSVEFGPEVAKILTPVREQVHLLHLGGYTIPAFRQLGLGDPEALLPGGKSGRK